MNLPMTRLWREPLLHFLLIGAALFGLYALTNDFQSEATKRIVVDRGQVEQLRAAFKLTWSRLPTSAELETMIENHVREEIFYREALARGLDQNDPMVRRRLRQKLEFMLEDLSAATVDDTEIENFYQTNLDRYRADAQATFRQVFLHPGSHADLELAAEQRLMQLADGADIQTVGDATLLATEFRLARQSEIARDFGPEFAEQVIAAPMQTWTGPIYSAFGAHLVRIDERISSRQLALDEVRPQVRRDYLVQRQQAQKDLAYQRLREGYEISIEQVTGTE